VFEGIRMFGMRERDGETRNDKKRAQARTRSAVGAAERRVSERSEGERSDTEQSERARRGEAPTAAARPERSSDPEVIEKPARRQFTAQYKMEILEKADSCTGIPGAIGSLLRREGLHSSNLRDWRRLRREGLLNVLGAQKRGRKPAYDHPLARRLAQVEREKRCLERRLKKMELLLDLQKKVSEALGISLEPTEADENFS